MKKIYFKKIGLFIILLVPVYVFGQSTPLANATTRDLLLGAVNVVKVVIRILYSVALLTFFWGVAKFIRDSGNPIEIQKGRQYMLWGVIALFILFSINGILLLISGEFGFGNISVGGLLLRFQ